MKKAMVKNLKDWRTTIPGLVISLVSIWMIYAKYDVYEYLLVLTFGLTLMGIQLPQFVERIIDRLTGIPTKVEVPDSDGEEEEEVVTPKK
jgi:hypothetical protein